MTDDDEGRYEWRAHGSGFALYDNALPESLMFKRDPLMRIKAHIYPYGNDTWKGRLASDHPFSSDNVHTFESLEEAKIAMQALYLLTKEK